MIAVTRMVLDVLKPMTPSLMEFATRLCSIKGINQVECTILEIDRETETIKIILEGDDLQYPVIEDVIASLGAAVHSIDSITARRSPERHKKPS